MTPDSRLRFLLWFARRDLFAPGALRATRVNRQTIALVTFFSLTALGLSLGVWQVRVKRQMRDRLNLCLFIGDPNQGLQVTPAVVERIRSEVPRQLHQPEKFLCYAFSEVRYDWFVEGADSRSLELRGRTIADGDPLLGSRELAERPEAGQPGRAGVAITPSMRRLLKLPTPLPATLRLRSPITSAVLEIPLAGVMKKGELPFEHEFVMPESVEAELIRKDPNTPSPFVDTGPIPADWPAIDRLPPAVQRAFQRYKWAPPQPSPRDRRVWRITSKLAPAPTRMLWNAYLLGLHGTMVELGYSRSTDFLIFWTPPDPQAPVGRTGHGMAGLYVGDEPDLKPAAAAVRSLQFKANESVIDALESIGTSSRLAFLILGLVALVFLFHGWSSMYVIQRLRSEQMRSEIGMLKAIGMEARSLRSLLLTEGLILWAGGTARGVVLGLATGYACAWGLIAETPDEVLTAFACPWWLWLPLLTTTALTFLGSSILASRAAREAPPILTLKGS
jgi:hypothetical protein